MGLPWSLYLMPNPASLSGYSHSVCSAWVPNQWITDWTLGNPEPKSIFPLLSYLCRVFCHSDVRFAKTIPSPKQSISAHLTDPAVGTRAQQRLSFKPSLSHWMLFCSQTQRSDRSWSSGKVHEYTVQGSSPQWRILPAPNLLRYPYTTLALGPVL